MTHVGDGKKDKCKTKPTRATNTARKILIVIVKLLSNTRKRRVRVILPKQFSRQVKQEYKEIRVKKEYIAKEGRN